MSHAPQLADVEVLCMPDGKRVSILHACVTPESGSAPEAAELIAYARERLAHYKCPTGITFVDALSRNSSSATSGRSSPDHLCGQALLNSAEERLGDTPRTEGEPDGDWCWTVQRDPRHLHATHRRDRVRRRQLRAGREGARRVQGHDRAPLRNQGQDPRCPA